MDGCSPSSEPLLSGGDCCEVAYFRDRLADGSDFNPTPFTVTTE